MNKWTHIIIHHSQSKDHDTLDYDNIKKWHTDMGWFDIGYNYIIDMVENNLVIIKGRTLLMNGAHTKGMNKKAIGICVVGNFDKTIPDNEIYLKVFGLCIELINTFNIPKENIKPHSDYSEKTCPGKLFDMNEIIKRLK